MTSLLKSDFWVKATMQLLQQSNTQTREKYFQENIQLIFRINLRIIFISIYTFGISYSPSPSFNYTSQTLYYQYSQNSFEDDDTRNPAQFPLPLAQERSGLAAPTFVCLTGFTFSKPIWGKNKETKQQHTSFWQKTRLSTCQSNWLLLLLQTFDFWQSKAHCSPWGILLCKPLVAMLKKLLLGNTARPPRSS